MSVPQPILLLHLAQLHLQHAHQLIPQLLRRPTHHYHLIGTLHYKHKPDPQPLLAQAASIYRQHITIAIGCLRAILALAQSSSAESIPAELNLIARCKLIQVLLSETKEHHQAIDLIQHGLHLSRQRDNLTPFKLTLSEFLISIEAANPNVSFRKIKKQIERAIEITIVNNAVDPKYTPWYYRFQLLFCHIFYERAKDYPAALAALRSVITLAELRDDWQLWVACKTREIKMAMDRCEWPWVYALFKALVPMIEFDIESQTSLATSENAPSVPTKKFVIGQQLKTYIMLLLTIYYSIAGETQLAKGWLKHLRTELDNPKREEGQAEGTCKIYLQSHSAQTYQHQTTQFSSSTTPYIIISIMPKDLMYTLTYLVSLAVCFDGHGKSPKSLIYAREGLKQIDRQLTLGFQSINSDNLIKNNTQQLQSSHSYYYPSMIISINSWLQTLMAFKLETNIMITQLAIVRSDFLYADQLLVELIRRVSDSTLWKSYNARISFLKSILSHATGNLPFARQSLLTTLYLVRSQTKSTNEAETLDFAGELSMLSKACYVLVRMAENDLTQNTRKSIDGSVSQLSDFPRSLALDHLIKELDIASHLSIPSVNMAIQVVMAMSCGEIVKAKYHLTTALNEANRTSNTHLKMILLGLLSTMFLNTRSDQATTMLKSCFKLSHGFCSSLVAPSNPPEPTHKGDQKVNGMEAVIVGNPSLGLWVGKRLLEIYESQLSSAINEDERRSVEARIHKFKSSNTAHQQVIAQIPLL